MKKVIILLGGPSKGTRFRPLSLDIPKPLFPIGGAPILTHHLNACAKVPDVQEVILLGFFPPKQFEEYIASASKDFKFAIKYIFEGPNLGTAGGLWKFKDQILTGSPSALILIHCDILCAFPLNEMLEFHAAHKSLVTLLGKKVDEREATNYGCMVTKPPAAGASAGAVLHFAEKPETFVSNLANCGVYVFSPAIFARIQHAAETEQKEDDDSLFLSSSSETPSPGRSSKGIRDRAISLEKDVFVPMAGADELYCYETKDFWVQVKNAGYVTQLNQILLAQLRKSSPAQLAKHHADAKTGPAITGDVHIHPTAVVHPTAKLGPNVTIGANVTVRAGARIKHAIILDHSEVKEHALVSYSVIGMGCSIGQWCRVEGVTPTADDKIDKSSVGITIFGQDVTAAPEIIIRSSIVLPHKSLTESYSNEILL